jgi:uncharacterized protein YodC (DUF2158 family)
MNPGDEVVLRSGGPRMTVQKVEHETAVVSWFNGVLNTAVLSVPALKPAENPWSLFYSLYGKGLQRVELYDQSHADWSEARLREHYILPSTVYALELRRTYKQEDGTWKPEIRQVSG